MKKITINKRILVPLFFLFAIGTIYAFRFPEKDVLVSREVAVIYGNTKGLCVGSGICQIIKPERFPNNSFDAMGEFVIDRNENVSLRIKKNSISVAKAEEQFGNGSFEIDREIELAPILGRDLQKRGGENKKIKKGKFSVKEDKDYYIISF